MSTLSVSNITDGTTTVGTSYVVNGSVKQWVNFNGQGTVAIRQSLNTASITDVGVGDYRPNFTSAMSTDTDPACVTGKTNSVSNSGNATTLYMFTASQMFLKTYEAGSVQDPSIVSAATFGDLA